MRQEGSYAARRIGLKRSRVEACLAMARQCNAEFAGAWVLHEAQKSGVSWFPNLRSLVAAGILRRIDVTRGGRRGYYVMLDPEGVEKALRDMHSGGRA